jgi:hypothetical protein
MYATDTDELVRLRFDPPLPCATRDCGRPATRALAERDAVFTELWRMLPFCDTCAASLATERSMGQADDKDAVRDMRHGTERK